MTVLLSVLSIAIYAQAKPRFQGGRVKITESETQAFELFKCLFCQGHSTYVEQGIQFSQIHFAQGASGCF